MFHSTTTPLLKLLQKKAPLNASEGQKEEFHITWPNKTTQTTDIGKSFILK
jgi:hypothetical protein